MLICGYEAPKVCLMVGLDGNWYYTMLHQEALSRTIFSQLGVDGLSGSFDAYYPLQREYLLPTLLTLTQGIPSKAFFFDAYAILLVLSVYICGRSLGFAKPVALIAGFLMAALALPLANSIAKFFPLFQANPFWCQAVAAGLLIVAALWALDGRGLWRNLALGAVPVVCLMVTIVGEAPHVLFMAPTTALYGGAALLAASSWRERSARAAAIAVAIGVPIALGCLTYYYGIISYTAYRFFPAEIEHPLGGWLALSTAFWTSPVGKPVIGMGLAGAVWAVAAGPRNLRCFGLTHFVGTACYFAIAIWMAFYSVDYRGSWPVYFETGIWPVALLFAAYLSANLLQVVCRPVLRLARLPAPGSGEIFGWGLLAASLAVVVGLDLTALREAPLCAATGWDPARPTAITEALRQAVSLRPGEPFRGLAMTLDGVKPDKPADWISLHDEDQKIWTATGNDHRTTGLWAYQIPTLFQYHTFISPPYYLMLTEFLATAEDRQLRSQVVMSRLDPAYLRLIGVRYVIGDHDIGDLGRVDARVPMKGGAALRLVELSDPNLGNYSPTATTRAADFRTGIARMHAADFDGRNEVVTDADLSGPFVAATHVQLTYERYGLHLTADSAGRSLLVLPAQFSHCWHAEGAGNTQLFRADLMQLGVAFSGKLDTRLVFRLGPILAGSCRVEDFHDMQRLRIRDARPRAASTK